MSKLRLAWYLVFAVVVAGMFIGSPWLFAIGGLTLFTFSLAIATNWRGSLDGMQRAEGFGPFSGLRGSDALRGTFAPFSGPRGRDNLRATFALFAAIGALLLVTGLVRLLI